MSYTHLTTTNPWQSWCCDSCDIVSASLLYPKTIVYRHDAVRYGRHQSQPLQAHDSDRQHTKDFFPDMTGVHPATSHRNHACCSTSACPPPHAHVLQHALHNNHPLQTLAQHTPTSYKASLL